MAIIFIKTACIHLCLYSHKNTCKKTKFKKYKKDTMLSKSFCHLQLSELQIPPDIISYLFVVYPSRDGVHIYVYLLLNIPIYNIDDILYNHKPYFKLKNVLLFCLQKKFLHFSTSITLTSHIPCLPSHHQTETLGWFGIIIFKYTVMYWQIIYLTVYRSLNII